MDVGCGAGILSEGLGRLGMKSVLGIDPTPRCIELAQAHLDTTDLTEKVEYRNISLEELISEDTHKFDLVCCSEVIEHVDHQKQFLQDCAKLVRQDGHLFLSSIAKTPEAYFLNIVMGEYVLGLLPKGTHEWDQLINQSTCEGYLDEVDFETYARSGVTITCPVTKQMGEISSLNSNYMMMARKK